MNRHEITLWRIVTMLSFGLSFALYIIVLQDDVISELEARQPKITEECIEGILHNVQNFDGLKVYNSKFQECGR